MKLDVKNTARLAVVAGLCASLTLGGAPMMALAVELGTGDAEEPQRTEVSAAPENEGDKAAPAGDGEEGVRAVPLRTLTMRAAPRVPPPQTVELMRNLPPRRRR